MKPPVAKNRLAPELRARVLELRRTHSAGEVAKLTGLPVGTIKALTSRAGVTRDNTLARAFFALPALVLGDLTAMATPAALPEQRNITGDVDTDAMLWLRQVIETGDAALIAKAMQAAERIKTPSKELERRYADHLVRASGGNIMQGLFSCGFADLPGHAKNVLDKQARRHEALARFGSEADVFADTAPERFCIDALAKVKPGKEWGRYPLKATCAAFEAHAAMRPHTLGDCLAELAYWDDLYHLRSAWPNSSDALPQVGAREAYLHHCMGLLRPKDRGEAKEVLRYLASAHGKDSVDENATDLILLNLVG